MNTVFFYHTALGGLTIVENDRTIVEISFGDVPKVTENIQETPLIMQAAGQIEEYLAGWRKIFDLPIAAIGTDFQKTVWQALTEIPYGETRSYQQIARQIGNDKAYRAVGLANNRNPLPILIPCHRVIGANGSLTGYAGGIAMKEQLLAIEENNR